MQASSRVESHLNRVMAPSLKGFVASASDRQTDTQREKERQTERETERQTERETTSRRLVFILKGVCEYLSLVSGRRGESIAVGTQGRTS